MKKRTAVAALIIAVSLSTSGIGRAQPKEQLGLRLICSDCLDGGIEQGQFGLLNGAQRRIDTQNSKRHECSPSLPWIAQ